MSDQWRWVSLESAMKAHRKQIDKYGGGGHALRDAGRLEAAIIHPQTLAGYAPDADVPRLGAAYAHGLAKGHAFVDGNKRIAWVVARLFMLKNGYQINASQAARYDKMYGLAAGDLSEEQFADWLRGVVVPTK